MNLTEKSNKKIAVEMWADYMCPLCYIGKTNLENAIKEFKHKEDIEVSYRPFQLYPNAPVNKERNYYEYTSGTHNNISVDYLREANAKIVAMAKSVGLNYDLDRLIPTNTTDALRITLYAKEKGKDKEISAKLYSAYFEKGLDIADETTLANIGAEIGLNPEEIFRILKTDQYKKELNESRSIAESIGVRGTPFLNMNSKIGVSGIKSKEEILSILNQVWTDENNTKLDIIQGESCGIDGQCE